jgi:hypothetical protein
MAVSRGDTSVTGPQPVAGLMCCWDSHHLCNGLKQRHCSIPPAMGADFTSAGAKHAGEVHCNKPQRYKQLPNQRQRMHAADMRLLV